MTTEENLNELNLWNKLSSILRNLFLTAQKYHSGINIRNEELPRWCLTEDYVHYLTQTKPRFVERSCDFGWDGFYTLTFPSLRNGCCKLVLPLCNDDIDLKKSTIKCQISNTWEWKVWCSSSVTWQAGTVDVSKEHIPARVSTSTSYSIGFPWGWTPDHSRKTNKCLLN